MTFLKQRPQNYVKFPFKSAKHGRDGHVFARSLFNDFISSIPRDDRFFNQRAWVLQEKPSFASHYLLWTSANALGIPGEHFLGN